MKSQARLALPVAAMLVGCGGTNPANLQSSTLPQDGGSANSAPTEEGGASDASSVDATLGIPGADAAAMTAMDGASAKAAAADAPSEAPVRVIPLPSLHVAGNRITDNGTPVILTGVQRAGTEYSCVHGTGIFDGPSDAASVQAIKSWTNVNAVRIPLNEDCWLGINGVSPQYSGTAYQNAITSYVTLLLENGLYAILDLHWSAPASTAAMGTAVMPDQDHSPAFWSQVAGVFKGNLGVAFDLFNEPDPGAGQETADAWTCWRDGSSSSVDAGACAAVGYAAAGMQTLLSTVRAAGADNLVFLAGIVGANALSQWSVYKPADPANNTAAAWHAYAGRACSTVSCFDSKVGPIAQMYPVVATEIGEQDCMGTFIGTVMGWLDSHQLGYSAFTWDSWSGNCLSLVSDYTGTPTNPYGSTYKSHLLSLLDGGGD